jgi:hypothetical protein
LNRGEKPSKKWVESSCLYKILEMRSQSHARAGYILIVIGLRVELSHLRQFLTIHTRDVKRKVRHLTNFRLTIFLFERLLPLFTARTTKPQARCWCSGSQRKPSASPRLYPVNIMESSQPRFNCRIKYVQVLTDQIVSIAQPNGLTVQPAYEGITSTKKLTVLYRVD